LKAKKEKEKFKVKHTVVEGRWREAKYELKRSEQADEVQTIQILPHEVRELQATYLPYPLAADVRQPWKPISPRR